MLILTLDQRRVGIVKNFVAKPSRVHNSTVPIFPPQLRQAIAQAKFCCSLPLSDDAAMALFSARDTISPPLCSARGRHRPTYSFRECEDLQRFHVMGPLSTESIFWSQAEDTKVIDDRVAVG